MTLTTRVEQATGPDRELFREACATRISYHGET